MLVRFWFGPGSVTPPIASTFVSSILVLPGRRSWPRWTSRHTEAVLSGFGAAARANHLPTVSWSRRFAGVGCAIVHAVEHPDAAHARLTNPSSRFKRKRPGSSGDPGR